jgi:hypothetical protein
VATSTMKDMRWREDLGPTDVARANGEVLGAAASLVARVSGLVALVIVGVFATFASRGVAAGSSVHAARFVAESVRDLGVHFVVVSALLLVVVMLGSMFLWRRILAPARPGSFIRLLDEARRSILRARGAGDLAARQPLRVNRRCIREAAPNGVLEQLRQSLILSPLAPPGGVVSNRSIHRVLSNVFSEVALTR